MQIKLPTGETIENVKTIYHLIDSKHTNDCVHMENTNSFVFEDRAGNRTIVHGMPFSTSILEEDDDYRIIHSMKTLKKKEGRNGGETN